MVRLAIIVHINTEFVLVRLVRRGRTHGIDERSKIDVNTPAFTCGQSIKPNGEYIYN